MCFCVIRVLTIRFKMLELISANYNILNMGLDNDNEGPVDHMRLPLRPDVMRDAMARFMDLKSDASDRLLQDVFAGGVEEQLLPFESGVLKPAVMHRMIHTLSDELSAMITLRDAGDSFDSDRAATLLRNLGVLIGCFEGYLEQYYDENEARKFVERLIDILVRFLSDYAKIDVTEVGEDFRSRLAGVSSVLGIERNVADTGDLLKTDVARKFHQWFADLVAARLQKKVAEESRDLSMTDQLTGLLNRHGAEIYNRRIFMEARLASGGQRASDILDNKGCAVIFLDIDHFKRFNDEHGHASGDAVLKHCARIISMLSRDGDVVSRRGGEEIVVTLSNASEEESLLIAERFRSHVEEEGSSIQEGLPPVTVSVGVFHCSGDAVPHEPDTAINYADRAMYGAKQQGRNKVVYYDHQAQRYRTVESVSKTEGDSPSDYTIAVVSSDPFSVDVN